jgi:hypothetical protein
MVIVQFTNGFGNNLFQYNAAKLLAEFHNQEVNIIPPSVDYYAIPYFQKLGANFVESRINPSVLVHVNDSNYKEMFKKTDSTFNFLISGYFEDYTIFDKHIDVIKGWYPKVESRNNEDLVLHFRAGDRLFYKNEFHTKPKVEDFINTIEKFDFEKLHIVTDMKKWDEITEEELLSMRFHHEVPLTDRVETKRSVDYFNSFVTGLAKYDPTVVNRSVAEDFEFIRTFDNIMLQHGTTSWWAAALSEASCIGVYGPWRPWKGASNKNLGRYDREGWFSWE